MDRCLYPLLCFFLSTCFVHAANAEDHVVTAQVTKYSPEVVFIQPEDRVIWTNMVGHDTQSIDELMPEGAEPFQLVLGQNGSVTFNVEGVYIYKCNPHFALGMVGAVVVGQPSNLDDVLKNAKGMAKRAALKTKKSIENQAGL